MLRQKKSYKNFNNCIQTIFFIQVKKETKSWFLKMQDFQFENRISQRFGIILASESFLISSPFLL